MLPVAVASHSPPALAKPSQPQCAATVAGDAGRQAGAADDCRRHCLGSPTWRRVQLFKKPETAAPMRLRSMCVMAADSVYRRQSTALPHRTAWIV